MVIGIIVGICIGLYIAGLIYVIYNLVREDKRYAVWQGRFDLRSKISSWLYKTDYDVWEEFTNEFPAEDL